MTTLGAPRRSRRGPARDAAGALLALAIAFACARESAAAAAVRVGLAPANARIAVGDTLRLELRVTATGPAFNGYDAVVAYDTTALAFLPAAPLARQEGAAMKAPCGNTFHRFQAAGDSLVIDHVILCAGKSLRDPGTLYQLRFVARAAGDAPVRVRRTEFFDAGRSLGPALSTDTSLRIDPRPGVPDAPRRR